MYSDLAGLFTFLVAIVMLLVVFPTIEHFRWKVQVRLVDATEAVFEVLSIHTVLDLREITETFGSTATPKQVRHALESMIKFGMLEPAGDVTDRRFRLTADGIVGGFKEYYRRYWEADAEWQRCRLMAAGCC